MKENNKPPAPDAWLFLGPEIGEKQTAIEKLIAELRESFAPASSASLEETSYYAGDTPVTAMIPAMQNPSLFADARLFLIKNAEQIKKKDELDLLVSFLKSQHKDTRLIFTSDETAISKQIENQIPPLNKKIFWELLDHKKHEWVENFFRKEGFKISAEGIETILELVENNTAALKQECSRLCLFLDKNKEASAEDAEKWLSHTREESPFILFSRIAQGDFSRSLESARILLAAKESPVAIFAALASCFRKLIAYLALKEAGFGSDFEYRKIGVFSPGAKRDYAAAAKHYDSGAAESCLVLTTEYDLRLRSSGAFPGQMLMDQFLYKVHALAKVIK
jgi:DNA polymerase-3 subunit delta